jgi:microsomal dipeptidase-like Zn-dependent dipeptidase
VRFIDLHAHYPMHLGLPKSMSDNPITKLAKQALFDLANEVRNFEPINKPRVTAGRILESKITGLASVLYDPEDEFLVAQEPHPIAIEHIRQQIRDVERDAAVHALGVAKTLTELQTYINESRPFIVHCVEGGHALSGDPDNVKELEQSGVTYLILAHLRYMGLAGCAKGLPCKGNFWQDLINHGQDPAIGLSNAGFQVLETILSSRIILDVTHCSHLSRKDIMTYYTSSGSHRPIISSHSGTQYLANYELNVSDEWIKFIADTGGVIGVILFPFWLANSPKGKKGIDLVGDTIDRKRLTNTPVRQARSVLKCPDDRKNRVVSAQTTYPCGSSAVGGRVCEQRHAAERVLPESRFELQHAGSPSKETALEKKA